MLNRRSFFTRLSALVALCFAPKALQAQKPLALPAPGIDPGIDQRVRWGPGTQHPHWRVPLGRWTFVEDKR